MVLAMERKQVLGVSHAYPCQKSKSCMWMGWGISGITLRSLGPDHVDRDLLLDMKPHLAEGEHRFQRFEGHQNLSTPVGAKESFPLKVPPGQVCLCGMACSTLSAEPISVISGFWLLGGS